MAFFCVKSYATSSPAGNAPTTHHHAAAEHASKAMAELVENEKDLSDSTGSGKNLDSFVNKAQDILHKEFSALKTLGGKSLGGSVNVAKIEAGVTKEINRLKTFVQSGIQKVDSARKFSAEFKNRRTSSARGRICHC